MYILIDNWSHWCWFWALWGSEDSFFCVTCFLLFYHVRIFRVWWITVKASSLHATNLKKQYIVILTFHPEWMTESCEVVLTLESVDQILWCDHSNEISSAVLSHGAIYLVCSSNFWVFWSVVWPFKWNLFSSIFTWYYLFSICCNTVLLTF